MSINSATVFLIIGNCLDVCLVVPQALRSHEGNEAQVCLFIIQLLLLKPHDFRTRVNAFIREVRHGNQSRNHEILVSSNALIKVELPL